MNLPKRLAQLGQVSPGQEALVYKDKRFSYLELNTLVNRLASGLRQTGLRSGDKILVALGNSPEFVLSYYAILKIKCIIVPINPQYTTGEIASILCDCQPKAVITEPSLALQFNKLSRDHAIKITIITTGECEDKSCFNFEELVARGNEAQDTATAINRNDVAEILYTAGNSPRGAMLTHNNLYSNATTFADICHMTPKDRALLIAPVYHSAAQTCVMNNTLVSGATLIIHRGWAGPVPLIETIQNEKITFYFGPPSMYALLVEDKNCSTDKYDTSSLRLAFTGASALTVDLFNKFEKKFGLQLTEGYGLTETSPVVTSNPPSGLKKPGSAGLPISGVEMMIVDYEDNEVPRGQVGEIVIKGPNVMLGYYNREEDTKWIMRNGWFHSGDLAYLDEDGYVFIVDRKKDLIIRGGLNIYPREVEEALYLHPGIYEVAVVGVPDPVMGEEVMAIIMTRKGKTIEAEEVKEFCRDKLAKYKIPRHIKFVDNIPKTTSGKLLKGELKKIMDI